MTKIERIEAALVQLDPDMDREAWIRVGMALKSELGEGGFELWDRWSQGGGSYSESRIKHDWRAIRADGGTTIGTLFHMVRENVGEIPLGWAGAHRPGPAPARTETNRPPPSSPNPGHRELARKLWSVPDRSGVRFDDDVAEHPYAKKKLVSHAFGAKRARFRKGGARPKPLLGLGHDLLVVPIRQHGTGPGLAVQVIDADGQKRTLGGMDAPDRSPGYLLLGNEHDRDHPWRVVEGWATAFAVHTSLERLQRWAPVLVAFGLARMNKVAKDAGRRYGARIVVMNDGESWS